MKNKRPRLRKDLDHPWRAENTGRLLLNALNDFQSALVVELRKAGFKDLRTAHMSLLRHLDANGTRITEIARRAGITKQAAGQLVADCEELKLVRTTLDPDDGRAKIVTFSERGRSIIIAERAIIEEIEQRFQSALGKETYSAMRVALEKLPECLNDR
jgi:DNA-binding MarR family transcriptional regulator